MRKKMVFFQLRLIVSAPTRKPILWDGRLCLFIVFKPDNFSPDQPVVGGAKNEEIADSSVAGIKASNFEKQQN